MKARYEGSSDTQTSYNISLGSIVLKSFAKWKIKSNKHTNNLLDNKFYGEFEYKERARQNWSASVLDVRE